MDSRQAQLEASQELTKLLALDLPSLTWHVSNVLTGKLDGQVDARADDADTISLITAWAEALGSSVDARRGYTDKFTIVSTTAQLTPNISAVVWGMVDKSEGYAA